MTDPHDPDRAGHEEPGTDPPDDPIAPEAPAPQRSAPGRGGWAASSGRRHQDSYDTATAIRALRGDIDELRRDLRRNLSGSREELRREFRDGIRETAGYISELLPRVDHLETVLAQLASSANSTRPTDHPGATSADPDDRGPCEDPPPVTPAVGWSAMDRATAEQAWTALAEFVDTVLFCQYRLTRLQIPDCWPVHPRLVRELAWLRSSYLEAQQEEAEAPAASLPWHIRAIPGFLINAAEAIDPRECRPGIHRLTDPEVSRYTTQRATARHEGRPEPVLTSETGPDRPQLHPEHYPTRTTSTAAPPQNGAEPKAPTVTNLPELIVGACHPENWISYYREASAGDLAARPD